MSIIDSRLKTKIKNTNRAPLHNTHLTYDKHCLKLNLSSRKGTNMQQTSTTENRSDDAGRRPVREAKRTLRKLQASGVEMGETL